MSCRLLVILSLLVHLTQCGTFDAAKIDKYKETSQAILLERKPLTARRWKKTQIHAESAFEYIRNRTALLLAGNVKIQFQEQKKIPAEQETLQARFTISGEAFEFGTATAISPLGYYLTAAHCVVKKPLQLICIDSRGSHQFRARIVWIGQADRLDMPDMALIHIPHRPQVHFQLAAPYRLRPSMPILTAGFGGVNSGIRRIGCSSGEILKLNHEQKHTYRTRWTEFQHNAPLLQGDSGGPIIDRLGQLVGITSSIEFTVHQWFGRYWVRDYAATAICPDPAWIDELIRIDQARLN